MYAKSNVDGIKHTCVVLEKIVHLKYMYNFNKRCQSSLFAKCQCVTLFNYKAQVKLF